MDIKNQLCSFEQSERLVELGIHNASYFLFNPRGDIMEAWMMDDEDEFHPAFTAAELGMMLPDRPKDENSATLEIFKEFEHYTHGGKWNFCRTGQYHQFGLYNTEAQARAAMLIYLLENKLIKAEEVNESLEAV